MLTARYFGPTNFGVINYAAALVAFAEPIMLLGLNNTLVRELINEPDKEGETLGTAIVMSALSAILCIVGIFCFSSIADAGNTESILVCLLYSLCLFTHALELPAYWFDSKYLAKYKSVVALVAYFLVSLYKFYLLATNKSIYWFALSNTLDYLLIAGVQFFLYRRMGGKPLSFSWKRAKALFSRSHPYIMASLMVTIFAQTDKVMIKWMIGEEANGYYSAAVSVANMAGFVFAAIIDSMRTTILESAGKDEEAFEEKMRTLYSVISYLSLLQRVGITLLSGVVIHLAYGSEYAASVSPLRIIVWYTTFAYLGAVRNVWILAKQKQQYLWIINMSGALGNIALNAILIPLMGINGAALASLVTQFFTNVVMGYIVKPICANNRLMIQGLHPQYFIRSFWEILQTVSNKKTHANKE